MLAAAQAAPQQVAALGAGDRRLRGGAGRAPRRRRGGGGATRRRWRRTSPTRSVEIARLLATLETISRAPPPPRALHPDGPLGAARAAAMTERLTPALRAEAERLRGAARGAAAARGRCASRATPSWPPRSGR